MLTSLCKQMKQPFSSALWLLLNFPNELSTQSRPGGSVPFGHIIDWNSAGRWKNTTCDQFPLLRKHRSLSHNPPDRSARTVNKKEEYWFSYSVSISQTAIAEQLYLRIRFVHLLPPPYTCLSEKRSERCPGLFRYC